jgi:HSP20 family molecular chaperone IbpA
MRNNLTPRNSDSLFNFFDQAFSDLFSVPTFYNRHSRMSTDIKEGEKEYELRVDMPGFDKSEISLTLENGYLTVSAEKKENEEDEKAYIRRERNFSCKRSYYVGNHVQVEDVTAKYENGTLKIVVPKKQALPPKNSNIEIG